MKKKLLYRIVAEMRSAQPFTKFAVATSYGAVAWMFLVFIASVGNSVAVVVAIAVAVVLGLLFRSG